VNSSCLTCSGKGYNNFDFPCHLKNQKAGGMLHLQQSSLRGPWFHTVVESGGVQRMKEQQMLISKFVSGSVLCCVKDYKYV
jgi:hypothetical protein